MPRYAVTASRRVTETFYVTADSPARAIELCSEGLHDDSEFCEGSPFDDLSHPDVELLDDDDDDEAWCNHDPVAVTAGVCECGATVADDA